MALCADPAAQCVLTSSTMTITGAGTQVDPYDLSGDGLTSVVDYASLSNPAAMPNGAAFLVEEATEIVVVKDGLYFIPGQHFYELQGDLDPINPSANAPVNFEITNIKKPAPVIISLGGMTMNSFFHPAELTLYAMRTFLKTGTFRPHTVAVAVGGDPNTYELVTEATRWEDDADTLTVIPIGRAQTSSLSGEKLSPFVLSSGAVTIIYKNISTGQTLASPSFLEIGLNWGVL